MGNAMNPKVLPFFTHNSSKAKELLTFAIYPQPSSAEKGVKMKMKRNMKNRIALAILLLSMGASAFAQNVILLIPDGMSVAGTTL